MAIPALDSFTVGLIYSILNAGMAVFVMLASREAEEQRGFAEWRLACIGIAIGAPINVLQDHLPLGLAIGVSNFCFMLAWGNYYAALATFFGRPVRQARIWQLAVAHALIMTYLAVGLSSIPARLYWYNGVALATAIAALTLLKPPAGGTMRMAIRLTRAAFILLALLHGLRLLWFAIMGAPAIVIGPSPIQSLVGIGLSLAHICATFGFLLMQNRRLTDELRNQADFDGLTGLLNRRAFQVRALRLCERGRQDGRDLVLLMLDLDHFKRINDAYGHQTGDDALRWLSEVLGELVRPGDLLARYGGEEFIVLLPDTNVGNARLIAERIRATIATQSPVFRPELHLTLSIGLAPVQASSYDLERSIQAADAGLYQAKHNGRNQVCHLSSERQDGKLQLA